MAMTREIDCMACIANLAAGIPFDEGIHYIWLDMVHGSYWDMATGITRLLCMFSWADDAWTVSIGPSRGYRLVNLHGP